MRKFRRPDGLYFGSGLGFTMNATNCSDGVDGLAGTLTVITLAMIAVLLYVVIGYRSVAHYLLVPIVLVNGGGGLGNLVLLQLVVMPILLIKVR